MKAISATQAKQQFAALLDSAQREPVRIRRHKRVVAVLVSAEEFERFRQTRWEEFNRLATATVEEVAAEIEGGPPY